MRASNAARLPAETMISPTSRAQNRERRAAIAEAPPTNATLIKTPQITIKAARASSGQCTKLRRHQGSAARRAISPYTRASSVSGARRRGSSRRVRSSSRSNASSGSFVVISVFQAIGRDAVGLQQGKQRGSPAPYVGFNFGKRSTESYGDILVGM